MPAIAIATLIVLVGAVELISRVMFTAHGSTIPCLIIDDAATGVRGVPGAVCREKTAETGEVRYAFNDRGFRTPQQGTAKLASRPRIVMIGSSLVYGMRATQQDSFAGRLPAILERRLGRPVDVYNEGMQWGTPASVALKIAKVRDVRPDVLVWPVSAWDIENAALVLPYIEGRQETRAAGASSPPAAPSGFAARLRAGLRKHGSLGGLLGAQRDRAIERLGRSDTAFLIQYLIYQSPSQFLRHAMMQGDAKDYLRSTITPYWRERLDIFARNFRVVADQAKADGIPLVMIILPSRLQATMVSTGSVEPGYDPDRPYQLVRPIAEARGAYVLDILPLLGRDPRASSLFLTIDEHLTNAGNDAVAEYIAQALITHGPPILRKRSTDATPAARVG